MCRSLSIFISLLILSCNVSNQNSKTANESVSISAEKEKPNVIVILLDDAGYVDFGFMGSEDLETPHIDNLAQNGVVFTDAHVTSTVCAPSRAGLITGQYQQRFGFEANHTGDKRTGDIGLSEDVVTIAEVFKQNGYNTSAIGKWHLGEKPHNHPNQRGFDDFYGFLGGARSYFPMKNPSKVQRLQYNGEQVNFDGYLTDVLGDFSVEFVEKNKDQPFFMYLAYNAVHTPMEAKEEHLKRYANHSRKELAAMTWSLDENIGKLTQKLEEHDLLDNTLIYFLSDNGGAHNNQSSSGPLKGWKGNKFEGGHRVPFVVSWPKHIKKGWTFDGLTSSLDIFKTSIEAAQLSLDENLQLDGVNLLPFLTKEKKGHPHTSLNWRKLEESATRMRNYKLISLKDYGHVLYDLNQDLGETTDVSTIDSETFKNVLKVYNDWESQMMQPLWGEERKWMEVTHHIHKQLMQNEKIYYQSPGEMKTFSKNNEE